MDSVSFAILFATTLWIATRLIRSRTREMLDRHRQVRAHRAESGRIGWLVLWLLGVPIPVLLVVYLLRGCT